MYDENILLKLKNYLNRINYHLLLTLLLGEEVYFVNPLPDYKTVINNLSKVDLRYRSIIKFFLLGEPIDKIILDEELDESLINYLYEIEVINKDQTSYWLNNYCLTSYCNCYVLVSNVFYYPTCQSREQKPYIGIDSYWLARIVVNRVYGKVLDLCTGSGIQAILAAQTAEKVVAVDLDPESVNIARLNVCINGLSSKIKVLSGDLYECINREKFDFIISNPPFIPIPIGVNFHICGDGGEDGMSIIRRIIKGYKSHLKPNGEAIMIGQCIGTFDNALIKGVIEEESPGQEYNLIIQKSIPIESQAFGFSKLSTIYNGKSVSSDEWLENYRKMGMTHFHTFTLFEKLTDGTNQVVRIADTWSSEMIPISALSSIKEVSKNYLLTSNKGNKMIVDEETALFLNAIDGKTELVEILKKMPLKYRLKDGNNGTINMLVKYASVCSQLERQSMIERVGSKP